jgi:hypothetical protein
MPWTVDDVERHNKGLSAREKRQWCHVANGALEAGDDDGTAITKANGVAKKGRIQETEETEASEKAETASKLADETGKSRHHNDAYHLHRNAAFLHMNAGNREKEVHHRQQAQSHELTSRYCKESIESRLYAKATALVENVRMQVVADVFEGVEQPESVLGTHGWKQSSEKGDRKIYTHPTKTGHEIHVDSHGGWRHYDGDKCLQAGFTGEKMRKHLGEAVLAEADPKPRVEIDHMGKPVIPNRQQYLMYFQDMQAGHIKQSVLNAHASWAAAEKTALAARQAALSNKSQAAKEHAASAAAHLKALGMEMSVANMVMKQKQTKENKLTRKSNQKIKQRTSTANKFVNIATKKQSPMVKMLAKAAVKTFMQKPKDVQKPKNFLATPKAPSVSRSTP